MYPSARRRAKRVASALLLAFALAPLLAAPLTACDDASEPGSFSLAFIWPDNAAPDVTARPLWARAVLQQWPSGDRNNAITLNTAGPVKLADDASAQLNFGDLTYGDDRVVVVELRNGENATDQLFYFGVSQLFSFTENDNDKIVNVNLQLQAAPGTATDGSISTAAIRFVVAGQLVTSRSPSRLVDIETNLDLTDIAQVTLANNASLSRGRRDLTATDLTQREPSPLDDTYTQLINDWNLDDGLDESIRGLDGERTVFIRLTNAAGIEGPVIPASITVDETPPRLLNSSVSPTSVGARGVAILAFSFDEPVDPEAIVVRVGGETLGTEVSPAPEPSPSEDPDAAPARARVNKARDLQQSFEFAWFPPTPDATDTPPLPDGEYDVTVSGARDTVGNNTDTLTLGSFTLDQTPPVIELLALTTTNPNPAYAKAADIVTARIKISDNFPASFNPDVRFDDQPMTKADVEFDEDGNQIVSWTYEIPTSANRLASVTVAANDAADNLARLTSLDRITLDTTPPALVAPAGAPTANASVQLTPAATNLLASVTAVTTGTTIRVTLTANEDLTAPPTLTSTAPEAGLAFTCSGTGRFFTCDHTYADTSPTEGSYTLTASLTDLAGNAAQPATSLAAPGFTVDTLAPTPPATDTPDAIIYRRIPWGADETSGLPRFVATGTAGAVEPNTRVFAISNLGATLGDAPADQNGAFSNLLVASDQSQLRLIATDTAGNASTPSIVRDIEWVATLGGKVLGSTLENPHEFGTTPAHSDLLINPDPVALDPDTLTHLALPDDQTLSRHGTPIWRNRTFDDFNQNPLFLHSLAYDAARGNTIRFGGFNNGGTSQTWQWDGVSWRFVATTGPVPRHHQSMAYDHRTGNIILFGGLSNTVGTCGDPNSQLCNDTWRWNGTTWARALSPSAPSPRYAAAATFDTARGKLVLYGGLGEDGLDGDCNFDTWEWNGNAWSQVDTNGPPVCGGHAITYDAARKKTLLFGGYDKQRLLADTWQWDGSQWQKLNVTGPSPRADHAITFDSVRNRIVLFGGTENFNTNSGAPEGPGSQETWEWDGTSWYLASTSGPPPRYQHAIAFDALNRNVVLFGGAVSLAGMRDTWLWNGLEWQQAAIAPPPPRAFHAAAYDPSRKAVVVFAGSGDAQLLSDTIVWNGAAWRQIVPPSPAAFRYAHRLALDPNRDALIAFGGRNVTTNLHDTKLLANSSWSQIATSGPPQNISHTMTHDEARQNVVLFGGADDLVTANLFADTWLWNGSAWAKTPLTGPSARRDHAAAYHRTRQTVVIVGGTGSTGTLDDIWEWNGTQWNITQNATPLARTNHAIAYDPLRDNIILFGGKNLDQTYDETWAWKNSTWHQLDTHGPEPRTSHTMVYDELRERFVLFGGLGAMGTDRLFDDTWELDTGFRSAPRHAASFFFNAALARDPAILNASARWLAGGVGYPDGAITTGTELLVWDEGQWKPVASNTSAPDAPTELTWTTTDPLVLNRIFFGDNKALNFAARPKAPNGTGHPTDPDKPYGEIATDYIEVTVKYRLP